MHTDDGNHDDGNLDDGRIGTPRDGQRDDAYVLWIDQVDRSQVAATGGKAASLGELSRIDGINVPDGFCVTTAAYARMLAATPAIGRGVDALAHLGRGDDAGVERVGGAIRAAIETSPMPDDVADEIRSALARLGTRACAVRSSATVEDAPGTSFAGLHDSFLDVVGEDAVIAHVRRCWASLFGDRATAARLRYGVDHRDVAMAVVVQRMVDPIASGVMFTADPVTSHRGVVAIEAVLGLGEAMVAGRVSPDHFEVRAGAITARTIAATRAARPTLTDRQVLQLARLGRLIETHLGRPQDIEWCLDAGGFRIVQSRPVTTLFPVPVADDDAFHVYVSVGHQQMMTDAMRPLGLSLFELTSIGRRYAAGGRLFVDVAPQLGSPAIRAGLIDRLGSSDPLTGDALRTVVDRGLVPLSPNTDVAPPPGVAPSPPAPPDPGIVADLVAETEASLAALRSEIETLTGEALVEFVLADVQELRRLLSDPRSMQVIIAAIDAGRWLNEQVGTWLGEPGAADALAQAVDGNVTAEMGLELLDVADAVRPHPEVVAFLRTATDDDFLDRLDGLDGGREARAALTAWLDRYGMRCVGEIDITRPRWIERPSMLLPVLLGNVDGFARGERWRRAERGRSEARRLERELLGRVRALPDGVERAAETRQMIERLHAFAGYREFPKYGIVRRYFVYKQALLGEADRLVQAGGIGGRDDVFFLTLPELREAVRTRRVDPDLIGGRRREFDSFQALTPPRVMTSDGEVFAGSYRRTDLAPGSLAGLGVSAGVAEGRARVLSDPGDGELDPGDVLVTTFTDPSWTPLFLRAAAVVTEVGGRMTHGAVIAREFGVPAVVGVEGATRRIAAGRRVRVDGSLGVVQLLDEPGGTDGQITPG